MKKSKKIIFIMVIAVLFLASLSACKMSADLAPSDNYYSINESESITDGNTYEEIVEQPFMAVSEQPTSYISMDTNSAAYANLRNCILNGYAINPNQVRTEDMVNYFDYNYDEPTGNEILSRNVEMATCPWNEDNMLLKIGLQAEEIDATEISNNLVFLLDVSGSMNSSNKLGLLQEAFTMLVENLGSDDRVSIVTYAGADRVLLEGVSGDEKETILETISSLSAGGSTAGADGINTAYELAEEYFITGGNNVVMLATDGDFNVGVSTNWGLNNLISEKRETGIYLSVYGFGYGNLRDDKMESLATNGNGTYAFIDSVTEARKQLVEEIGGTFNIVARDVKAKIEFNPAKIESYRIIGYENTLLTSDEWEDNSTDAGEIGSGHSVTAIYEIVLADANNTEQSTMDENLLEISIKYKSPVVGEDEVLELTELIGEDYITQTPSNDMQFISAVVEFSLVLRDSEYKGTSSLETILARLNTLDLSDDSYKAEFKSIIEAMIDTIN